VSRHGEYADGLEPLAGNLGQFEPQRVIPPLGTEDPEGFARTWILAFVLFTHLDHDLGLVAEPFGGGARAASVLSHCAGLLEVEEFPGGRLRIGWAGRRRERDEETLTVAEDVRGLPLARFRVRYASVLAARRVANDEPGLRS